MFLPTHWLYFIDNEGNEENVANTDCSTKQEVRDEAKYILLMYEKQGDDITRYTRVQYRDRNDKVLYECSIKECI